MSGTNWVDRTVKPRVLEKGETVEGLLLSIKSGGQSNVLMIQNVEGVVERLWSSCVLDNALQTSDIGSTVRITFNGMVETKAGRTVRDFKVEVAQAEASESLPDESEEPPADAIPF